MQAQQFREIISTHPFNVGWFEVNTDQKMQLEVSSCLIALNPHKAQLIVNSELIPLSNGDVIQASPKTEVAIIGRSKFIYFNDDQRVNLDKLRIFNLSQLKSSYFYSNKKLTLQKVNEEDILCLSQENDFVVKIDLHNEKATIFGDSEDTSLPIRLRPN